MADLSPDIILWFFTFVIVAFFMLAALQVSVLILLLRRLPQQGQADRTAQVAIDAILETARVAQEVVAGALTEGQAAQAAMVGQLIKTLEGHLAVITSMAARQEDQNNLIADLITALTIQNESAAGMCDIITRQGAESKADSRALLAEVRGIRRLGGGGE